MKDTKPGECVILYLACPQPSINTDDNREDDESVLLFISVFGTFFLTLINSAWLDQLFITVNVNFRIK